MAVFLSFEGGDGVGKSTQLRLLARWLKEKGVRVLLTREPGGSPLGEALRRRMLRNPVPAPRLQALLFMGARREHIAAKIAPARRQGTWVLCDRFCDSTFVYQGGALRLPVLHQWHKEFCGGLVPDCTILLDAPLRISLARLDARPMRRGFDAQSAEWHRAIQRRFRALARQNSERFVRVDASLSEAETARRIRDAVQSRFGL